MRQTDEEAKRRYQQFARIY